MIVDEIQARNPPGRFLKQEASTKLWYDIGEKKALDKTRQALREGAPELMKEMTPGDEIGSDADGDRPVQKVRNFYVARGSKQDVSRPHSNRNHVMCYQ